MFLFFISLFFIYLFFFNNRLLFNYNFFFSWQHLYYAMLSISVFTYIFYYSLTYITVICFIFYFIDILFYFYLFFYFQLTPAVLMCQYFSSSNSYHHVISSRCMYIVRTLYNKYILLYNESRSA